MIKKNEWMNKKYADSVGTHPLSTLWYFVYHIPNRSRILQMFFGDRKTRVPREKPLGGRTRINSKLLPAYDTVSEFTRGALLAGRLSFPWLIFWRSFESKNIHPWLIHVRYLEFVTWHIICVRSHCIFRRRILTVRCWNFLGRVLNH